MAILTVGLLITVHLLLLFNLRFEAWPEMLVYPYLINNGFKLYQDIINPYPPLFTYFLAGYFKIFPLTVFNLQVLTWTIILLTDWLIYFIASRRYGRTPALLALIFFIVFQPLLDGNGLWYDLVLVPILLLAFYFNSPTWLAISFFIKQSVIWLFLLFLKTWKKLLLSLILLFAISYVPFAISGTAADYLFWPWRFALTILPTMPGHKDFGSPLLWLIAVIPFVPLIFLKKTPPFLWTALSFLFVFPRFGLFHLQPALAFAALVIGQNTALLFKLLHSYTFKLFAIGYLLLASLLWFRHIRLYWHQPPRFFEPEILAAGQKLSALTQSDRPIFMLNAPDQLMILADRLPTKPWAITFPWYLELPGMQSRLVHSIQDQQPQAVLFGRYQHQGQFVPSSYIPKDIDKFIVKQFPQSISIDSNLSLLKPFKP